MRIRLGAEAEPEPSTELRDARHAIIGMGGVELLHDWEWHKGERKWVLHLRLEPDVKPDGLVPLSTDWFVRVVPAYPLGSIKFNPAKQNGLTLTFQHQSHNSEGPDSLPWRKGSLCLDTPARALGRRAFDIEPYDADKRLRWHVVRAQRWLEAASRDELVLPGEPFELPEYPADPSSPLTVAFSESPESFAAWQEISQQIGIVDFYVLRRVFDVQVAKSFRTFEGKHLPEPPWGPSVTKGASAISHGLWLRLRSTPVLKPWQSPVKWGELRAVCREQGVDLDELLHLAHEQVKDKDKMGQVALLGFPIPSAFGAVPERMHWLGLYLPKLIGGEAQAQGFRRGKNWSWQHNRDTLLRDNISLRWLDSENWYPDQLQTRGRLSDEVVSKKILMLGAGALGSTVAELLVRGGTHDMLIVDEDRLEAGNLVRHTLGLKEINEHKAEAVAARLNQISPFAHIEFITEHFPPSHPAVFAQVSACDLIVDCSGSDELLYELSAFQREREHLFFSLSVNLGASRGYCFTARGARFPHEAFRRLVEPWLRKDLEENAGNELPREGIGCWHTVFPARADDLWLMASAMVKHLERMVKTPPAEPVLVVFEQEVSEGDAFSGVRRISIEGLL